MSQVAIGLMSGTSGDGVSAALVGFQGRSFKLLHYETFAYPQSIRTRIIGAMQLKTREISELNVRLGEKFSQAVLGLLKRARFPRERVACIGSHGQTLYHGPRDIFPSTFQIGEGAVIAEKTGIPVVSDFRPQDVALGGEGAPLIPFFDFYFYGRGPLRAFQNIGGIANVALVGRNLKRPIAFDTGPGNSLIDLAIQKITKGRLSHDPRGRWASRGQIQRDWVKAMMRHPYFKRRPPKSTGRDEFGQDFLKEYLGNRLTRRPHDALATLTYLTALSIYESLRRFAPKSLKEMIVSGGGAYNLTLMTHLKELFSPTPVHTSEEFGIPPQAKEPIAFAFFALRAFQKEINHLPSVTGGRHATILGKLIRPAA